MAERPTRPVRRMTAEEHLEHQRQNIDRASLDLNVPENMLYPHVSTVQHIPVELHQDIANWFRRLGEQVLPSERYVPAHAGMPQREMALPADLVDWFERDGRDARTNIELVLREFVRSVENADEPAE